MFNTKPGVLFRCHLISFVSDRKDSIGLMSVCVDPEWGQGVRTPLKNYNSNTGPDPLKSHNCQASIQCWAIIGSPTKSHLNGVSLAGHFWTPSDKTFWIHIRTVPLIPDKKSATCYKVFIKKVSYGVSKWILQRNDRISTQRSHLKLKPFL